MSRGRTPPLPPDWSTRVRNVLARDNRVCYICRGPATEVDHIIPRFEGGGHDYSNLAAICTRCHRRKTAQEANRARRRKRSRRRTPEPHPGLVAAQRQKQTQTPGG